METNTKRKKKNSTQTELAISTKVGDTNNKIN